MLLSRAAAISPAQRVPWLDYINRINKSPIIYFIPIKPIICITWIWISIITTKIITSCCILNLILFTKLNYFIIYILTYIIVHEIRMCIIDTIIHNCCRNIFTCISKCPSFFDIKIKSSFATRLANIFLIRFLFYLIDKKNILPDTIDIENRDQLVIDIEEKLFWVQWENDSHVWHGCVEFDE